MKMGGAISDLRRVILVSSGAISNLDRAILAPL